MTSFSFDFFHGTIGEVVKLLIETNKFTPTLESLPNTSSIGIILL